MLAYLVLMSEHGQKKLLEVGMIAYSHFLRMRQNNVGMIIETLRTLSRHDWIGMYMILYHAQSYQIPAEWRIPNRRTPSKCQLKVTAASKGQL
jgi:hypothetical protein